MTKSTFVKLLIALGLAAAPVSAQNIDAMPEDHPIALSGVVESADIDSFVLDYGDGQVKVEMEGWGWYGNYYNALPGDRVSVYGDVDQEFFDNAEIEADSIYVENLNRYYYRDNLYANRYWAWRPIDRSSVTMSGEITAIHEIDEFTLDLGYRTIDVEVEDMLYNPLVGPNALKVGETVMVTGNLEAEFFEAAELDADSITVLEHE